MELPDIKRHLSIATVLQHYNLTPDRSKQIRCPFHEDDTPSCRIYPETNSFHCFGCGASGDPIEFIEKYERISKREALVKATGLVGNAESRMQKAESGSGSVLPSAFAPSAEILPRAFTHFVRSLNVKPKKAIVYLESRKLDYTRLAIGYDTGTLHKLPGTTRLQKQEYLQAGLLKPDKFNRPNCYYTRFNNCIVFPLLDKNGNITSLYGRHIESGHHYLEGEHRGLYPGYPKSDTKVLILTESVIDAATLQQEQNLLSAFLPSAFCLLALYGTNGFTEEHEQAIAELKELEEVILFFDGDEAGREGVKETALKIKQINEVVRITFVGTPEGEDVNSLAQSHESGIFAHLLEKREAFSFSTEKKKAESGMQNAESQPSAFVPSA